MKKTTTKKSHEKFLRTNQTDAETLLWQSLRAGRFEGFKFKRQVRFGPYIVDFVCKNKKIIIELDGGQHSEQIGYDQKRTNYLSDLGFHVRRFWNNEVFENLDGVLSEIAAELER